MRRLLLALSLAVLMVLSATGVALAGESKGPPGPGGAEGGDTPISGFWSGDGAASICSFSGLNDVVDESEPTQVQSYGRFLSFFKAALGLSAQEAKELFGESPGHECNPTRAPWGNIKKDGPPAPPPDDPV
jgi:hypothetical protein